MAPNTAPGLAHLHSRNLYQIPSPQNGGGECRNDYPGISAFPSGPQLDTETDPAKRAEIYKHAQDIYASLAVTLPLFLENEHVVHQDGIKGSTQYGSPEKPNIGSTLEFNYSTLVK